METRLVGPAHTGDSVHAVARSYCALLTTRRENVDGPPRISGSGVAAVQILEAYEDLPGQELQPHQDALIIKCEELAAKVK
jgi:hypothetical protein